jgi:general secretion pathway protein H
MTAPTSATEARPLRGCGRLGSARDRRAARGRRSACDRRAGFTLLETTLALALIGLIAALALPRVLPGASSTALRIKAFEIAALVRADRNAALRTGRTVSTAVDLAGRRVRSGASDASVAVPNHLGLRLVAGVPNGFRFFSDGSSSGGELILTKPGTALAVRVDGWTAAVAVASR